jgi:hypothetical protein
MRITTWVDHGYIAFLLWLRDERGGAQPRPWPRQTRRTHNA